MRKQMRLVLEQQCRDIASVIAQACPAGVGFLLFIADHGTSGHMAYVSSVERESAIKLVQEWLDRQDANHPAEGWQTAAMFLIRVAAAIGFDGPPEPEALLARLRELAAAR